MRSLTGGYGQLLQLLLENDLHPYRSPGPGKIMFPGAGADPNWWKLICAVASGTLHRFAFGQRFACEICARSERLVSEVWSARGRTGGHLPDLVPTEFPSTLPAPYSHTGKRANRETRVDTVRAG